MGDVGQLNKLSGSESEAKFCEMPTGAKNTKQTMAYVSKKQ